MRLATRLAPHQGLIAALTIAVLLIAPTGLTEAADGPAGSANLSDGDDQIQQFIRAQVGDQHRVEIRFGDLPAGTRLAPCERIEPFVASGARLWGNSRIGVRCLSGANWSISLPVSVKVYGPALVANQMLPARTAIASDDVRLEEVELTSLNATPLTDPQMLDGRMTTRPIAAGQTLMSYHVRIRPSIAVGDPVRVRVQGAGFSIMANGSALAPGSEGSPLRVRTDSGRVVVGTLIGRTVEIAP